MADRGPTPHLHLCADVLDKRWILLLDHFADLAELSLHLIEFQLSYQVPIFYELLYLTIGSENEATSEKLELLVGEHLIEEQITRVILISLHDALSVLTPTRLIEQLDEHGEIVGVQWLQSLLFFHFLIIKDIADVFVAEKVVFLTEKLDFDRVGVFIAALYERF